MSGPGGRAPVLAARDLRAGCAARVVIDAITLDIAPGTVTCLVGPKGSGTSTLLGEPDPAAGPAGGGGAAGGRELARMPSRAIAQRLAMLPQGPVTPEQHSVRELVEQGRYAHVGPMRMPRRSDAGIVDRAWRPPASPISAPQPGASAIVVGRCRWRPVWGGRRHSRRRPIIPVVTDRGRDPAITEVIEASEDAMLVLAAERDHVGAVTGFRVREANRAAVALLGLAPGEAPGRALAGLAALADPAALVAAYAGVLAGGEPDSSPLALVGAAESRTLRQRAVAAGDGVAVTIRDLTREREVDESLRRRLRENRVLADEQAALRRVATAVASEPEAGEIFSHVAEELTRLPGVDAAMVCRFERDRAVVVGAFGEGGAQVGLTSPLGRQGTLSQVYATRRPARVDSYQELALRLAPDAPPVPRDFRAGVAAPIWVGSALWGAVLAVVRDDRSIPPEAEGRLQGFGELVALAIGNADSRARLASEATSDHLTGLANHRSFHEHLHAAVQQARRHRRDLSLVLLDIDFFKRVNDRYGHQVGDTVLAEMARRLLGQSRAGELVARVGGEEFGWILPDSGGLGALSAAQRARDAVAGEPFATAGALTISAGVADLSQAGPPGALFWLADRALYQAKREGRDTCRLAGADLVFELRGGRERDRARA